MYDYYYLGSTWFCEDDEGDGGYNGDGGGSTGGGGNGGGVSPSSNLSAIANNVSLTSAQISDLNSILEQLLLDCGFLFMNGYIIDQGYKFYDIFIDSSISPGSAGYNPFTGNLRFYSSNEINMNMFSEEFIHLYQASYYGSSQMQTYASTARGNIEFEAKLLQDLLCWLKGHGCSFLAAGTNNLTSYSDWISLLTSDGTLFGTRFPTMQEIMNTTVNGVGYWNFLSDFVQKPGHYYNSSIDLSLNPGALFNINSTDITNCLN